MILTTERKILAVDMEGAGISAAAEQMSVPYLLVRGNIRQC
jgi:nucleoside phosphorylase